MFVDASDLIARTINDLESIADLLKKESEEHTLDDRLAPLDARTAKETTLTISILLPKLRAVQAGVGRTPYPRTCANCDEV